MRIIAAAEHQIPVNDTQANEPRAIELPNDADPLAIDLAGVELLEELHHDLTARGIAMRLAEARGQVRDVLLRAGFESRGVPVVQNQPVATVIAQWRM